MKFLDRLLQQWRMKKACRHIPPDARVLDIGSADDGALYALLGRVREFVGIDPDIDANRPIGDTGRLLKGFFPQALEATERFDVITMLAVLEHIPAREQAVLARDIEHRLVSGGRLIVTVPSPAVDWVLAGLKLLRLVDGMSLEQHYGFDVASTVPLFERAGLRLVRRERFQLGLNNLFVFAKPRA